MQKLLGFCAGKWRSTIECGLNLAVPFRSGSPEVERAASVAPTSEITMGQDVHSNQCIELKGICEFDADDFVEDERKGGFSALLARSKSDPKRITFDLALALSGFERSLSKRGEAKRLRNRARHPTDGRTGIEQGGCLVAAEISYREGSED